MYRWETVPWHFVERDVFKLQKRIYRASSRGDSKRVRKLQKLLINNRAAKLLAVRRVTQDNRGKNTAGVDGVGSLTPEERLELVERLKVGAEADPVRRVYIPKPGSEELRPLGIPTVHDRALQTLVKLALEPEWEARFEPNSYGFRPGRSCWDAIAAIFDAVKLMDKYVLDADIAKCFDRINHEALLKKVNASPAITRQLRAWLKAGILDGDELFPSEEGTPQGGAISPLLANVALHGLEELLRQRFPRRQRTVNGREEFVPPPNVIRYADDFVVLHKDEALVRECQQVVAEWLRGMGLELKPSKTRVGHTLKEVDGRAGFDFLGFSVRQFPVGKTRSGSKSNGERIGFKTIIRPSKESVKRHVARLREVIDQHKDAPQAALIGRLNPIIRGWANYYSTVVSSKTFAKVHNVLFHMLRGWANRRHPNKSGRWIGRKYWRAGDGQGWRFQLPGTPIRLCSQMDTRIVRHAKVQHARSPFDGDWIYWSTRLGRYPDVFPVVAKLLKRQKGICQRCGLFFKQDDEWGVDHILPKSRGGTDKLSNLQLLHLHCHQRKSAEDRQRGVDDNHQVTEERNEGKLSRSVLKPSQGSDTPA
jgi:RNA-directed DNA polymerase